MSIKVTNLEAGYGSRKVLTGVNFKLERGKLCALLGRNGCGKTTLIRCINAIIKPRKGSVYLDGKNTANLSRPEIAQLVSLVPQSSTLAFDYTCLEVVLMGEVSRLSLWASPGAAAEEEARQVLAGMGIAHLTDRPFNQLSGGEKQLVLVARALFQRAPYMLLDEPTSHLDFYNQHQIMSIVQRLVKEANFTVLVTLHDPNLALYYCDEVILIHEGQILDKGDTMEVLTSDTLSKVYGTNVSIDRTRLEGLPVVVPELKVALAAGRQLTAV
ncbi:MAG: ABC transporter ATP-binding protein [Clostridia bacterium]|nr:ABC transporter ATP-binding protein [Clostridia bacterium]